MESRFYEGGTLTRMFRPRSSELIFVFGSNLAGRHGAGAALTARQKYGAIYGQGSGLQGASYAIPTKDARLKTLPLEQIASHVRLFLSYASHQPDLRFMVTRIGCGLAGYRNEDIAPMFASAPSNCIFDEQWRPWAGQYYFS